MSENVSPRVEGLLRSITEVTGEQVAFLMTSTGERPSEHSWEVTGENGDRYGFLSVGVEDMIDEKHKKLYVQLAQMIATEIDLRRQNLTLEARFRILDSQNTELAAINRALSDMAYRDPLTSLYGRVYLVEQFRLELSRAARYARPFAVLMIDLDNFKRINDTHGHAAGDAVLKTFAHILKESCRTTDIVSRIGGDEFCALLADTPHEGALEVAERIRRRCAEENFVFDEQPVRITSSLGVGSYSEEAARKGISVEEILDEIDKSMYSAKRSGRNRVASLQPVSGMPVIPRRQPDRLDS